VTPFEQRILVTRPLLPPLQQFSAGLEEIWDRRWLTNAGPVHERFRGKLARLFETPGLSLFANGALALEAGLASLRLDGEVVTTPFTFPATANAIARCGLVPVFADIEPINLTLDPAAAEAAITPRTSAILAVHVYGNPAELEALAGIAERHGIALVYDAAHAFGARVGGRPIATFGDLSMFSFHATKPFHSGEGGALASPDEALLERCRQFANHGMDSGLDVAVPGTNAKMSELHALLGELLLDGLENRRLANGAIASRYRQNLAGIPGIAMLPETEAGVEPSHAFFPILVDSGLYGRDAGMLQRALNELNVETRRYFAPLVCDLGAFASAPRADQLDCARRTAERVLTLPVYPDLALEDVDRISEMIATLAAG
jgi:dTDP-4-amino-4,6-dideoxygalactose transaminase